MALNEGRLLKPDTIALMYDARLEPVRAYADKAPYRMDSRRGLIWAVDKDDGRTVVSHSGSVKSFNACLVNYPDEDVAAAILYNAAGPATCNEAKALAGFFLADPGRNK